MCQQSSVCTVASFVLLHRFTGQFTQLFSPPPPPCPTPSQQCQISKWDCMSRTDEIRGWQPYPGLELNLETCMHTVTLHSDWSLVFMWGWFVRWQNRSWWIVLGEFLNTELLVGHCCVCPSVAGYNTWVKCFLSCLWLMLVSYEWHSRTSDEISD